MKTPRPALAVVALAALAALVTAGCTSGPDAAPSPSSVGDLLDEVRTAQIDDRSHVDTAVDYDQVPPLGGAHAPVWANCGFYPDQDVPDELAVHSLEHGAVWITFPADGEFDQQALGDLAAGQSHVLVNPSPDVDQVTATAWGAQLAVDALDDPALAAFIETYVQGPQTPEPGATCSGGVGEPAS